VAVGVVYVSSADGRLYALGASQGTVRWTTALGAQLDSSPVLGAGLVYVGSEVSDTSGSLCAVSTDGRVVTEYQTGAQVQSSPVIADGRVYVGSDNNEVLAEGLPG